MYSDRDDCSKKDERRRAALDVEIFDGHSRDLMWKSGLRQERRHSDSLEFQLDRSIQFQLFTSRPVSLLDISIIHHEN